MFVEEGSEFFDLSCTLPLGYQAMVLIPVKGIYGIYNNNDISSHYALPGIHPSH